jgi:hypothetical protein
VGGKVNPVETGAGASRANVVLIRCIEPGATPGSSNADLFAGLHQFYTILFTLYTWFTPIFRLITIIFFG